VTKTDAKGAALLKHRLTAPRRPTIAAECDKVARRAAADNAGRLAFLPQVCEREFIVRERKAAERRLKAARFPAVKALDEFDVAARPSVNKPLILDLARGEDRARHENVLVVGPSGTGKTHPATGARSWRRPARVTASRTPRAAADPNRRPDDAINRRPTNGGWD
jgi:DNA replication protein DnaC